ncbi:uncharacterized protein LOC141852478 [Brevipalpus obovatus]|uniref:uncharacterized protein LOC141852478 n=1 Tax=Brevipalpus obovatus TaxID=246614 RepID=UPI003D9EF6D2
MITSLTPEYFLLWILMITFFFITGNSALRINRLEVPSSVAIGTSVVFHCDYDLEGYELYTVKWYKNYVEFYSYIPSQDDKVKTHKLDGAYVDVFRSNATHVFLEPIDLRSEATYACEVSTEKDYATLRAERQMKVYVLPREPIKIEGREAQYDIGSDINLTCISPPSKPAAQLTWTINDRKAQANEVVKYSTLNSTDGLRISRLGLLIKAYLGYYDRGFLRLQCRAELILTYRFEAAEYPLGDGPRNKSHRSMHGTEVKVARETPTISISIPRKEFHRPQVGEKLLLNCTSHADAAQLTWYINDDKVSPEQIILYGRRHGPRSVVGLSLTVEQAHFQLPEFKVRCVAKYHYTVKEYLSEELELRTQDQFFSEMKSQEVSYINSASRGVARGLSARALICITTLFISSLYLNSWIISHYS